MSQFINKTDQQNEVFFIGRKNLIKRCLNNLFDNAFNY